MAELQKRMSSREFSEWIAFARTEPIGGQRGDVQAATIAAMIANAYRDSKKRQSPYSVRDLLHDYWPVPEGADLALAAVAPGERPAPRLRSPDGALESRALWEKVRSWAIWAGDKKQEAG